MLGMEMMLSSLTGMKPNEIQEMMKGVVQLMETAASDLAAIKTRLENIETAISLTEKETVNGGRKRISNSNGSEHVQL